MHAVEELPPGPAAPAAAQTVEWIARPTDLLRRSAARYGEPFTLRTLWADAPMVLVSDPETIKRVYAAPPERAARRRQLDRARAVRRAELDPRSRAARRTCASAG